MQTMFTMPTFVRFGRGSRRDLVPMLRDSGVSRVFLVTDAGVLAAGLAEESLNAMRDAGIEVLIHSAVQANAPDTGIMKATEEARAFNPDAIVSLGGGSVIDTAKGVNILLSNPAPLSLYDGVNLVKNPGRLHVAIPTTAGTSSEMTVVAVISDTKEAKKMVLFGKNVNASAALIDPELTYGLPPSITAHTGMDALTHAIEAYLSTAASPMTDAIAPEAVALIAKNLPLAYENGGNREARDAVMLGCQMAGVCFSNAGLGLVHSLAQPMGAHCHVPHGLANAICLATVMRYTLPAVPESKTVRLAAALGIEVKGKIKPDLDVAVADCLAGLARRLDIPTIAEAGVTRKAIAAMSEDALKELSTPTTPRMPTVAEVEALYGELFAHAETAGTGRRMPGNGPREFFRQPRSN